MNIATGKIYNDPEEIELARRRGEELMELTPEQEKMIKDIPLIKFSKGSFKPVLK